MLPGLLKALLRLTVMVISAVTITGTAHAALSFELRTGSSTTNTQAIVIDSNKCPLNGPTAAFVGGIIRNTGATTATNINATMSGLNANIYLAGGQPAAQFIGALDPNETIAVFWLVGVRCADGATAASSISLSSSAGTQSASIGLSVKKAVSADAGGKVVSSQLGPGAIVGQTIFFDANYDFGGSAPGDEFLLQPTGGQTFNASCFRLVGSEITSSNVAGVPVGSRDKLYYRQTVTQPGNNYVISVRYFFEYLCANASTTARPYAVQTSGTQLKYTGNFDGTGSIAIGFPGASNPFTITKTVSEGIAFVGTPGTLTYTVTISNPSVHPAILGRIVDQLPSGLTFAGIAPGSDVIATNSSSLPVVGATGTLSFVGKLGKSYALAAGGSVTLRYLATRPPGAGTFTNTATGYFGQASTPVAQATYDQVNVVPLAVSKVGTPISDPVQTDATPLNLPGALVEYLITVNNDNPLPIDANSVLVTDSTPPFLKACVASIGGAGPLVFQDGSTASALTYSFASLSDLSDSLAFSNDNGLTWSYVPVPDADNCDPAITDIRVGPSGAFAPNSSFSVRIRYVIEDN